MKLLYRAAEWHGFAKMRMHTDSTLKHLDDLTTEFGKLVRDFETSSRSQFTTVELPRETEARKRRHKQAQTSGVSHLKIQLAENGHDHSTFSHTSGTRLETMSSIRLFGGIDGISTQIVRGFQL
jgi:hypothetical protein